MLDSILGSCELTAAKTTPRQLLGHWQSTKFQRKQLEFQCWHLLVHHLEKPTVVSNPSPTLGTDAASLGELLVSIGAVPVSLCFDAMCRCSYWLGNLSVGIFCQHVFQVKCWFWILHLLNGPLLRQFSEIQRKLMIQHKQILYKSIRIIQRRNGFLITLLPTQVSLASPRGSRQWFYCHMTKALNPNRRNPFAPPCLDSMHNGQVIMSRCFVQIPQKHAMKLFFYKLFRGQWYLPDSHSSKLWFVPVDFHCAIHIQILEALEVLLLN